MNYVPELLDGSTKVIDLSADYRLDSVTGKAHVQHFEVTCSLGDSAKSARGEGTSRRRAEQAAARSMLGLLTGDDAS